MKCDWKLLGLLGGLVLAIGCSGGGNKCEGAECAAPDAGSGQNPIPGTSKCAGGCTGGTSVCDEDQGVCVTCTQNAGCPTGLMCDTGVQGGACVQCMSDAECPSARPMCDVVQGQCMTCTASAGCTGARPYCDTSVPGGACGQCRAGQDATDCPDPAAPFCSAGTCVPTPPAITSAQIQAVRDAPPVTSLTLPVRGAQVTYVRPLVGDPAADPAGFFLQAEKGGPAIFVAVDPATLTPRPTVGDVVDLTVTSTAVVAGQKRAATLTGFSVLSTGGSVTALAQDVTNDASVVTGLDTYDGRLVTVQATVLTGIAASGQDHRMMRLTTPALADGSLRMRTSNPTATALTQAVDFGPGCSVTFAANPIWRINGEAHVLFFNTAEVLSVVCSPPALESAVATSPTSVQLNFSRALDAASIVANGSQFTLSGGLTVSAAAVQDRKVTLTTSPMTGGTSYTVTADPTVKDVTGSVMPAGASATFTGFIAPAQLVFTEVQPQLASNNDLIEFQALSGGSLEGIRLIYLGGSRTTPFLVFPQGMVVEAGDVVLVHLNKTGAAEVTSKTDHPSSAVPANSDDAYDLYAGAQTGMDNRVNRVLLLETPGGELLDGVFFVGTTVAGTPAVSNLGVINGLARVQAANMWSPEDCGGARCTATSTPPIQEVGVPWTDVGEGQSLQRVLLSHPDGRNNWTVGGASMGH